MRVKVSLVTLTTLIYLNLVYSQQAIKGISTSSSDITLLKYYGETLDTIATSKTSTDGAFNFNNLLSTGYYRLCQDSVKVDFIHSKNKGTWIQITNNQIAIKSEESEILEVLKSRYLSNQKRIDNLRTLSSQSNDSVYIDRLNEQIENLRRKTYIFFDSLESERPNSFALATTLSYIKAIDKSTKSDYFKYMPINSTYLNSSLYPQLIMLYLKQYTNYDEDGFKNSIDRILNHTQADEAVHEYALEFLLSLFDKVGPQIIYDYIVDNYILNSSCGIETSSLSNERIQSYLNLRIGNKPENTRINDEDLYAVCNRKPRTIIVFWSSYCGHCKSKLPQLKSMLDSLHSDSYQVLSISLDTDLESFNEISKMYPWMHVCDQLSWDSPLARHFKVNKTPTIYTLSSEATIVSKSDKLAEIKEAIEIK